MEKYKLPIWQLFCHCAAIYCLLTFNFYNYLIALAVYFVTGCLGVTTTYHRLLAHKSFNTRPFYGKLGTIFATLGGIGSSIGWVSIHRQHHRYSDLEKDPHSPKFGFIKSFYGSMLVEPKIQYVTDLLRDNFQVTVHKYYWVINVCWAAILLLLGGVELWMTAHVFPSFILWTTMGIVNTFGHMWGYKNFPDTREDSRNNWLAALVAWGEGWHNNHHDDPGNWSFQQKWWEIDVTKCIIYLIKNDRVNVSNT
jgi:fatty-acid desaturase